MKHGSFLLPALLLAAAAQAQTSGSVGIGTPTPAATAALDITATGKGLLIPRMDSASRAQISSPPDGLMVFQTDGRQGFWYCLGNAWRYIPDQAKARDNLGSHTATQNLNLAGHALVGGAAASPGAVGLRVSSAGLVTLAGAYGNGGSNNGVGLRLENADAGLLATSTVGFGSLTPPATGAGDRMMWVPYFAAFRAGGVSGPQWDGGNLGFYSAAFGSSTTAQGAYSLASGSGSSAAGSASVALGAACKTKGEGSVALGFQNKAQSPYSLALGAGSVANGSHSISLGSKASSATFSGTFVAADASSTDSLRASGSHQFSARYAGGYRLYSKADLSVGVQVLPNQNAWTTLSDSTKKERLRLADGNRFLERINQMRLGSWNYKGQNPDTMRHYGPMAQDFYHAFGHDGVGRSGNPTGINQADFDGVNLIAIQALYRRLLALEAENARLRQHGQQQTTQLQALQQAAAAAGALDERLRRLEAQLTPQARRWAAGRAQAR